MWSVQCALIIAVMIFMQIKNKKKNKKLCTLCFLCMLQCQSPKLRHETETFSIENEKKKKKKAKNCIDKWFRNQARCHRCHASLMMAYIYHVRQTTANNLRVLRIEYRVSNQKPNTFKQIRQFVCILWC